MTPQEQLDRDLKRAGLDSLVDFSILANPRYVPNWHHYVVAEKLEKLAHHTVHGDGRNYFLILQQPPRHGKSQLASINFPAWYLGKHPEKEVIVASYSTDISGDFGMKARDIINTPLFRELFPNVRIRKDTDAKAKWLIEELDLKTGKPKIGNGGYTATSVGGALTGKGANVLILDDVVKNREEADSQRMRENTWQWWTSTAYTRLEPNAGVVLPMTRWHLDDIAGRIIESMKDRDDVILEIVTFPAIAMEDEQYRKKGEALWATKYPLPVLEAKKASMGILDWVALYQQSPITIENQLFKPGYFRYFEEADLKGKNLTFTIAVDPAGWDEGKAGSGNDETVISVVGKEPNNPQWYVMEIISGRLTPTQTIDALFMLNERYRPVRIGIETVAYQKSLSFFMKEEMNKRGLASTFPLITEINDTGGKRNTQYRIPALEPLYRTGLIYHRPNQYLKLESQLMGFPKASHDDHPDSLSLHIRLIEETDWGGLAKKNSREQYEVWQGVKPIWG